MGDLMKEPRFITAWSVRREKDWSIQEHRHHYYELVYYCQGSGETGIGDEDHVFSTKTYAIVPPEAPHDERHRIDGEVNCLGFDTETVIPAGLYWDPDGVISRIVRAIVEECAQQRYGYQDMIRAKLLELLVELKRSSGHSILPAPKNFEYVVNYITDNYYEKIAFSDLADHLNLSYDYFQHRFKQLMGVSPQGFLLKKRLEAAQELLRNSGASCTEIAYRCGFSNSSQFSMLFKRELGMTPFRYRREQSI